MTQCDCPEDVSNMGLPPYGQKWPGVVITALNLNINPSSSRVNQLMINLWYQRHYISI